MRVVELDRVRSEGPHRRRQRQDRGRREIAAKTQLPHLDPGGARSLGQRPARLAREDHVVPASGHAPRGEEDLVLAPSPAAGRVDVEHPHEGGTTPCCSSRSLASFTYV